MLQASLKANAGSLIKKVALYVQNQSEEFNPLSEVKLFVPCDKNLMKKFTALLLLIFLVFSCNTDEEEENNLLPDIPVDETIFLNNPEYINLQVVGGWAYSQGGISGIIIYHYNTNNYVAFERSAPHLSPQLCSQMTVENGIIMFCSCDDSEFNILNGAPLTDGVKYQARQYRVATMGANTLRITNF